MSVDRAWFISQAQAYARAADGSDFQIDLGSLHACDDRAPGASFDSHYARVDLWAAQNYDETYRHGTGWHVDVGSRVDGFCTHLLGADHNVMHVDVRDPGFDWPCFEWRRDDARTLDTFADASVSSLSCLHAAEHVGLGRYGDEIDPHGMAKCIASLARVLAPGGRLYFAVPIGRHRLIFNAHRIASPSWVISTFAAHGLTLESFAAVDDAGAWHPEARPEDYEGASYSCGAFLFTKAAT